MTITAGTSLQEVKTLIETVKTDAGSAKEAIQTKLQTGIIDALKENWYSEEAVYFMNSFGSTVYALTSEMAVQLNTVIYNIAGAYDYWVKSTAGQEVSEGDYDAAVDGGASTIQAEPDIQEGKSVSGAGGFLEPPTSGDGSSDTAATYSETAGGDGRNSAYSYISSEDTRVTLDVSGILPQSANEEVGINLEVAQTVSGNLSSIKEDIAGELTNLQQALNASAALIDSQEVQAAAIGTFYEATMNQVNKMFEFLTEGEYSLATSINKAVEKYGTTITTNISTDLESAASGDSASANTGSV